MDYKKIDKKSISAEGVSLDLPLDKRVTRKFVLKFLREQQKNLPSDINPSNSVLVHSEYRFERKTWADGKNGRLSCSRVYEVDGDKVKLIMEKNYVMY